MTKPRGCQKCREQKPVAWYIAHGTSITMSETQAIGITSNSHPPLPVRQGWFCTDCAMEQFGVSVGTESTVSEEKDAE